MASKDEAELMKRFLAEMSGGGGEANLLQSMMGGGGDQANMLQSMLAAMGGGDEKANMMENLIAALGEETSSGRALGGVCDNCGKTGKTKRCSTCGDVSYCSKECQRAAWRTHKFQCREKSALYCDNCKKVTNSHKRCARCKSAIYCSKECQREDWEGHRKVCSKHSDPFGDSKRPEKYDYMFANSPARDLLKLDELEGAAASSAAGGGEETVRVLLSGFCDLRHVLKSLSCLRLESGKLPGSVSKLDFVLSDLNPAVINKTSVLLFALINLMLKPEDREEEMEHEDAFLLDFIFDAWYSLGLTSKQSNYMHYILHFFQQHLCFPFCPSLNIAYHEEIQMMPLQVISCVTESILEGYPSIDRLLLQRELIDGKNTFEPYMGLSPESKASLTTLKEKGFTQQDPKQVCETNPLQLNMADNLELRYALAPGHCPFDGATLQELRNHGEEHGLWPNVMASYRSLVQSWIRGTLSTLQALNKVEHSPDGSDIEHQAVVTIALVPGNVENSAQFLHSINGPYDRIHLSNLGDWIGLETVVAPFAPLLNQKNPHAVLITDSLNWKPPGEECMLPDEQALVWWGRQCNPFSEYELREKNLQIAQAFFQSGPRLNLVTKLAQDLAFMRPAEFEWAMLKRHSQSHKKTFSLDCATLRAGPVDSNRIFKITLEESRETYRYRGHERYEHHLEWRHRAHFPLSESSPNTKSTKKNKNKKKKKR